MKYLLFLLAFLLLQGCTRVPPQIPETQATTPPTTEVTAPSTQATVPPTTEATVPSTEATVPPTTEATVPSTEATSPHQKEDLVYIRDFIPGLFVDLK